MSSALVSSTLAGGSFLGTDAPHTPHGWIALLMFAAVCFMACAHYVLYICNKVAGQGRQMMRESDAMYLQVSHGSSSTAMRHACFIFLEGWWAWCCVPLSSISRDYIYIYISICICLHSQTLPLPQMLSHSNLVDNSQRALNLYIVQVLRTPYIGRKIILWCSICCRGPIHIAFYSVKMLALLAAHLGRRHQGGENQSLWSPY